MAPPPLAKTARLSRNQHLDSCGAKMAIEARLSLSICGYYSPNGVLCQRSPRVAPSWPGSIKHSNQLTVNTQLMYSRLAILGTTMLVLVGNQGHADSLPNNFWPNSSFESGTNLDALDGSGTPTGWVRNGSDPTICQVASVNATNLAYAIMVNDNDSATYGEWDSSISLAGLVKAGETLNVQYSEMFSVQGGEMR